jgi:hypothetical protein
VSIKPENEPGVTPSPASGEKRAKQARAGRGLPIFIGGVAVAAFLLYLMVTVYGIMTAG